MPEVRFPERTVAFGNNQIELLIGARFVEDTNGVYTGIDYQGAIEFLINHPESFICDFCGVKPVDWRYRCGEFVMWDEADGIKHMSGTDWMACDKCSDLIEQDRWDALLERSARGYITKYNIMVTGFAEELTKSLVSELHSRFRDSRTSDRERV